MTFRQRQVLALVPARGGSKGVPRKNLRNLKGKPLMAHTIEAALQSSRVDRVYVSSDDEEILAAAGGFGARPLKRDHALATDTATAAEVVGDFLRRLPDDLAGADPFIVYLQPTSPLRTARHIDEAFDAMAALGGTMGMSVVPLKRTPFKSFKLSGAGLLESLFDEKLSNANRQSLPAAYYPNGAIYIFPASEFAARGGFPSNGSVPYVMSEGDSIDIDTEEDFAMVERA